MTWHLNKKFLISGLIFALLLTPKIIYGYDPDATPSPASGGGAKSGQTIHAKTVYAKPRLTKVRVPTILSNLATFLSFIGAKDLQSYMVGQAAQRFSDIKVQSDAIKDTGNRPFNNRYYQTTNTYYMPISVQENTLHAPADSNRQYAIAGKLCIKDPESGGWIQVDSTTNIESKSLNPDASIQGLEQAEQFAAMYAKKEITPDGSNNYNYEKEPLNTDVKVNLSCDEQLQGVNSPPANNNSQSQNTFSGGASVEESLMNTACDTLLALLGGCTDYDVYWLAAINKPYEASYYCNLSGQECPTNEEYPVEGNGGGILTSIPNTFQRQNTHGGPESQGFEGNGGTFDTKTDFPYYANTIDSNYIAYCIQTPYSLQPTILPQRNVGGATTDNPCSEFKPIPQPTTAPYELCKDEDFNGFRRYAKTGSGDGGPIGSLSGFSIAYRNPTCTINDQTATFVANILAKPWIGSEKSRTNFLANWKLVQDTAISYGWNPIFVMTLWLEESATGGSGFAQLGCTVGWDIGNSPIVMSNNSSICKQMACLFSHPVQDPNDLQGFMCSYNTGVCQTTSLGNWGFAKNIEFVYPKIAERMGYTGNHPCAFRK